MSGTVRSPIPAYRGRFAPTPSGPLHLGSLLTALASYLDARWHGGAWLLRIDDLDVPRCRPGMDARIFAQLEAHGLLWDETPRYPSAHREEYAVALERLRALGLIYACRCTRAELAASSRSGPDGPVYAGTCRSLALPTDGHALRLAVADETLEIDDGIRGRLRREAARDVGDFVVRRRDGVYGYQLACAVDEHAQRISDVVRGADLIGSSFAQLVVMRRLGLPPPRHHHVPLLVDRDGLKLSKQNHAAPLESARASDNLLRCLAWLQQSPPPALRAAPVPEILDWAIAHWRRPCAVASLAVSVEATP